MFCVELCRNSSQPCRYEPHRLMQDLNPYDHLRRFFRLCITHFKRNIQSLVHSVDHKVLEAMYSIASSEAHQNFDETLDLIRKGGPKAKGKFSNKSSK